MKSILSVPTVLDKLARALCVGVAVVLACVFVCSAPRMQLVFAEDVSKACIDGQGPGWRDLTEADFVNVNCAADTWSWKDGVISCTGTPVG